VRAVYTANSVNVQSHTIAKVSSSINANSMLHTADSMAISTSTLYRSSILQNYIQFNTANYTQFNAVVQYSSPILHTVWRYAAALCIIETHQFLLIELICTCVFLSFLVF